MTAQVINLYEKPKPKVERWCSFCKRKESQVPKMVSNSAEGNHLRCICSDCIALAHKKIHHGENNEVS